MTDPRVVVTKEANARTEIVARDKTAGKNRVFVVQYRQNTFGGDRTKMEQCTAEIREALLNGCTKEHALMLRHKYV